MKSTGVVRRIDDLGRIVIPKEIRRNLKIRDGENMEIFIDFDSVILKKYSKIEDVLTLAKRLVKMVNEITNYNILITDRENIIDSRIPIKKEEKTILTITDEVKKEGYFYGIPIISTGDSIGLILLMNNEPFNDIAQIVAKMLSYLICEQVDIN